MPCYRRAFFLKHHNTYRKRIRLAITITVAIVCAWAISGHVIWNVARQACYRYVHNLKQERSFRDTLILDKNTYEDPNSVAWMKHNEIRYTDRMFDIKKTITTGNTVILIGHYDDFEHALYKSLQKLFDDNEQQPEQRTTNWNNLTAILPVAYLSTAPLSESPDISLTAWSNCFYQSVNIPPLTGPPDSKHYIST